MFVWVTRLDASQLSLSLIFVPPEKSSSLGSGIKPPSPKGARPEQKVNLPEPVPLYITYLTAVPSGTSIVYFDDFYGKDRAQARQLAGL